MQRTLRSKKLRSLLYYEQQGKCAGCGCELPDDWHADHIEPWIKTRRTNVHEMQALCPACNLKKGSTMLRKHQAELQGIAKAIREGLSKSTKILAQVTPGGGKSGLPMILAKELAEPMGLRICWVVPRDALRIQGELDFVDPKKRAIFGHNSEIRAAGNDTRPARDTIGYITTYQAIAQNPDLHLDEFRLRPYILVLDENHHIPDKGLGDDEEARFYSAIAPLVNEARYVLLMSGTLERHDGYKIAFIPYTEICNAETPDLKNPEGWRAILYSRKDALEEGAIVPLHFHVMDGKARWFDPKTGEERRAESIAESQARDQSAILQTVLETDYAHHLLERCAASWQDYKTHVYPPAKMLVISPSIEVAKGYHKYLKGMGLHALIATSDNPEEARDNIKRFKKDINIIVTVGMAYEGLDVPQISHVACLTNIRSRPWIEQCICRANRTDPDKGKTHGFVYYPDDPRMQRIIDAIDAEQAAVILTWPKAKEERKGEAGGVKILPIVPLVSAGTRERGRGLEDGTRTDYNETRVLQDAMQIANIKGVSVVQIKQMMVAAGAAIVPNGNSPTPDYNEDILAPSEHEKRLRATITKTIERVCKGDPDKIIDLNMLLYKRYGRRETASIQDLQKIISYLADYYRDAV